MTIKKEKETNQIISKTRKEKKMNIQDGRAFLTQKSLPVFCSTTSRLTWGCNKTNIKNNEEQGVDCRQLRWRGIWKGVAAQTPLKYCNTSLAAHREKGSLL
ncbi:hypothetical protein CEXT_374041 [Caerostris extrusa]|uniref:Uncharacterized protein n=1 Tax=Caerostris extrusa TaxID=172846 RepID=A0AAV4YBX8_CAEEX|nr:hypothetical protein CEXT_374041 [Caerostris extrusa]